ncbi:uncharacterized protein F5891DRAFT_1065967 [Suillus fuscotomentosus]|uniref:Uncharacterized protein n=1 Tax=Suillus fuscotomentosus TaxID=1912939 RepID=A0AAD4DTF5_9AGAM|nr:uncharacterized protein F5891DRAFT_1065967 [Suillus fuscotomentosus]KAG1893536.1 hypothetical protein F5891DRAFT_1065967 [Suillus fuscotomentosus]
MSVCLRTGSICLSSAFILLVCILPSVLYCCITSNSFIYVGFQMQCQMLSHFRSILYTLHHHVKPQPWHVRSLI